MSRFLELKWTVTLKVDVVHALHVHDVVKQEVSELLELFLQVVLQFERVRDVLLGNDEEVVVADGPLGHRNIKIFGLTPDDQVSIDAFVVEAEPAVFVFLHFHALHFEINAQEAALDCELLVLLDKGFCSFHGLKLDKAVWLLLLLSAAITTAFAPAHLRIRRLGLTAEVLEARQVAMRRNKLLNLLLGNLLFEA